MLAYIGVGICALFILIGFKLEKLFFNPLILFCGIWAVVLLCSATYPKLTAPQDDIYWYIIAGIGCFGCGYVIARYTKRMIFLIGKRRLDNENSTYVLRYMALYIIGIICILSYLYNLYLVVAGAGSFNMAVMKAFLQTFTLRKSSWLNAFYFLLVEPLSIAIPIIAISNMVFGNRDKKLLSCAIVLLIIKTIANTTRNTVIVVIVYYVIGMIITIYKNNKVQELKRFLGKRKKQVRTAVIVAVIIFISMTVARGSKIVENVWVAFALPPRLFEVWKEEIDTNNILGYGFAALQGFIYPIFYVLKNILGIPMPENIETINDLITRTDTVFVWPGENVTANAYVSAFWFMYLDFRLIGIIVGSFLLGFISSKMYKNMMRNTNERSFSCFCFIINTVLFSLARFQFTGVSFALAFVYMHFLYKNCGGKRNENIVNK